MDFAVEKVGVEYYSEGADFMCVTHKGRYFYVCEFSNRVKQSTNIWEFSTTISSRLQPVISEISNWILGRIPSILQVEYYADSALLSVVVSNPAGRGSFHVRNFPGHRVCLPYDTEI